MVVWCGVGVLRWRGVGGVIPALKPLRPVATDYCEGRKLHSFFCFTLLSIRFSWVLCCFLFLFSFHLGEAGAVCNGLEGKMGGWCLLWLPAWSLMTRVVYLEGGRSHHFSSFLFSFFFLEASAIRTVLSVLTELVTSLRFQVAASRSEKRQIRSAGRSCI